MKKEIKIFHAHTRQIHFFHANYCTTTELYALPHVIFTCSKSTRKTSQNNKCITYNLQSVFMMIVEHSIMYAISMVLIKTFLLMSFLV